MDLSTIFLRVNRLLSSCRQRCRCSRPTLGACRRTTHSHSTTNFKEVVRWVEVVEHSKRRLIGRVTPTNSVSTLCGPRGSQLIATMNRGDLPLFGSCILLDPKPTSEIDREGCRGRSHAPTALHSFAGRDRCTLRAAQGPPTTRDLGLAANQRLHNEWEDCSPHR